MDAHREACGRQHRVLGHFLAVQSWIRRLDCIVLVRRDLEIFLGLERFKSQRIKWLKEDLKPWFEFQEAYYLTGSPSSLHSLFLSRVAISVHLPSGSMTTENRIKNMPKGSPKTERFTDVHKAGHRAPNEADIVKYLAVLDSGLSQPEPFSSVPNRP